MTYRWLPPPSTLPNISRDTHVWLAPLEGASFDVDWGRRQLSAEEQDRAARFKFERDRRRFIVAHAALRSILGSYLNVAPKDLQFAVGPNGKPKLAPMLAAQDFEFNLSHSYEVALIAVSRGKEIGVDVEFVKRDFAFDEVAVRFFSPREVASLHALPRHLQREAFYKCWTSKEALLKAKGVGLSGGLDEVELALTDDEQVIIKGTLPNWSLLELGGVEGYAGALAFEGLGWRLKCYLWQLPQTAPDHSH
jgi:4'-phosphopantetheinyl transferase